MNFSDILFFSKPSDVEKAKKDFGITGLSGSNFMVLPMPNDYYILFSNYGAAHDINTIGTNFVNHTTVWVIKNFTNLEAGTTDGFHIFSDDDINKLSKIFVSVSPSMNYNNFSFHALSFHDIRIVYESMCEILGCDAESSRPVYDPTNDGCTCRVCGAWYPMAISDGLSDGKMNCWTCSTYRLHMCRKAITSLKS